MIDTNVDPDLVTYPIPANDDAIRSAKLISSVIANAIIEGNQGKEVKEVASEEINVEEGSADNYINWDTIIEDLIKTIFIRRKTWQK